MSIADNAKFDDIATKVGFLRVPPPEVSSVFSLGGALRDVVRNVESFSDALALFQFADSVEDKKQGWSWKLIAARDSALQVYHLWHRLNDVRAALRNSPTLLSYVDTGELRLAAKLFDSHFKAHSVRHSVAHAAETANQADQHVVKNYEGYGMKITGAGGVFVPGGLQGNTYLATFKGEMVTLAMTDETLRKIYSVVEIFFNAFNDVIDASARLGVTQTLKQREQHPQ